MTQEDLIKKITQCRHSKKPSQLQFEWVKLDKTGFSRTLKVTTKYGFVFEIIWYTNQLTLVLPNNITIWATDIWCDSCMPRSSELDIRCSFENVDSGFCIPILYYKDEMPV